MRDINTECIIPIQPRTVDIILKYGFIGMLIWSVVLSLFLSLSFISMSVLSFFLLLRTLSKTNAEYEYTHTNEYFDIDLIVCRSKRKSVLSLSLSDVHIITPVDKSSVENYGSEVKKDFSGNAENNLYILEYSIGGKKQTIIVYLDKVMLNSLKACIPKKIAE